MEKSGSGSRGGAVDRRLGPYLLVSRVGAGGMGEVWRARDTRLERDVAIKIIIPDLLQNPRIRARFQREARAISSLSHANAAALYDIGSDDGADYLVMEYLEGQTLEQRLRRGKLPLDQALKIAGEIASALDHAHSRGVVHRDLKPGNIMLTRSGAKLLDFGLARLVDSAGEGPVDTRVPTDAHTEEGTVLGTIHYMAPEQVEGRTADARTDIHALGAVLYEMVSGRKAFDGDTKAGIGAAIVAGQPAPLDPETPLPVAHLITRCMATEPDDRFQTARDVAIEIDWLRTVSNPSLLSKRSAVRSKHRGAVMAAVVGAAALGAAAVTALVLRTREPEPSAPVYASFVPPGDVTLLATPFEISPDGTSIAFVGRMRGQRHSLWVRNLRSGEARPLPGTEMAFHPFWSPDSRSIGYVAGTRLWKVSLDGTPPETITDLDRGLGWGTWREDGIILFTGGNSRGIERISAQGSKATSVLRLPDSEQTIYAAPRWLPGGEQFLFVTWDRARKGRAWVGNLRGTEPRFLLNTDSQVSFVDGHLLFLRGNVLLAQRFDPDQVALRGAPRTLQKAVSTFSAIPSLLVYRTGESAKIDMELENSQITWSRRDGSRITTTAWPGGASWPRLSPDQTKILALVSNPLTGNVDLWVSDRDGRGQRRLTFDGSSFAVWAGDGGSVAYAPDSDRAIHVMPLSGSVKRRIPLPLSAQPVSWSPKTGDIVLTAFDEQSKGDIYLLSAANGKVRPLLRTPFWEWDPQLSPDGQQLVYVGSEQEGENAVFVRDIRDGGEKWQVASHAWMPAWRADGREIFYVRRDGMLMAVSVATEPRFAIGEPHALFPVNLRAGFWRQYDVTADGQQFLLNEVVSDAPENVTVVVNWRVEER